MTDIIRNLLDVQVNCLQVIFQFRSVGPTPVGPSEHPIGTDGTIPYNK